MYNKVDKFNYSTLNEGFKLNDCVKKFILKNME